MDDAAFIFHHRQVAGLPASGCCFMPNCVSPELCFALFSEGAGRQAGIMKYRFLLLMLICPVALADAVNIHQFPRGTQGILSVERLTQGKLLWLQGRVGEGSYTRVDGEGRHCTIKVPVVVANTGLGIDAVEGLSIIVMNKRLSEALIKGGAH